MNVRWDVIAEWGRQPDELDKIVADIRGPLTLMVVEVVQEPLRSLLVKEWAEIADRIEAVQHGDDANTEP